MPLLSYKETIEYNGYYLHMFIKSPSYTFLRVSVQTEIHILGRQAFTFHTERLLQCCETHWSGVGKY